MNSVLAVLVVAVFAYLGATLYRFERMSPTFRSFVASGFGFFAVGLALGPIFTNALSLEILSDLDVVLDLGLGWVGLLFGLQFNWAELRRLPTRTYGGATVESIVTIIAVAVGTALIAPTLGMDASPIFLGLALAAVAVVSSPTTATQVRQETAAKGPVTNAVLLIGSVDALPAVILMGVLLSWAPDAAPGVVPAGIARVGLAVGLAIVLGGLFHLLTLYRYDDNQLLVILVGAVTFIGGAAHVLGLSPLFVSLLVGLIVANTSPQRSRILAAFLSIEKPIYLVLCALAGAFWIPGPWAVLLLVTIFLALRALGKLLGGRLASLSAGLPKSGLFGVGPALIPHGGMAVAVALDAHQALTAEMSCIILTAAFASVLVASLVGPWATRRALRDAGELG